MRHCWKSSIYGARRDIGSNAGSGRHHRPSANLDMVRNCDTPAEHRPITNDNAARKPDLSGIM
jgi:hypothetical protein